MELRCFKGLFLIYEPQYQTLSIYDPRLNLGSYMTGEPQIQGWTWTYNSEQSVLWGYSVAALPQEDLKTDVGISFSNKKQGNRNTVHNVSCPVCTANGLFHNAE